MVKITLGDEVQDKVSGFKGIAIASHLYLHGCTRISVQPKMDKKTGKLPDASSFDEPQLKILKKNKVKQGSHKTGGPSKYEDTRRY